jgi:hypothetical protein
MKKYLLIFFFIFYAISSFADCNYNLNVPALVYTVSDINPTVSSNFTISTNDNKISSCQNFFITFSKGTYATDYNRKAKKTNSNSFVFYDLSKFINSSSILKGPNDAISINEVLEGILLTNQTKSMSYYFSYVRPGASPPLAGTYTDNIELNSYKGIFPDYQSNDKSKNLFISIIVPKLASLSLVDSGSSYDPNQSVKILDFGELVANQELGFDIRMVSNAGFQLKISSANNGSMNIAGNSDSNSKISYNFLINNQIINLSNSQSSPVIIANGSGVTPSGGAVVAARAVIQSVDQKSYGIYQDYLTVTITTTE